MNPFKEIAKLEKALKAASIAQRIRIQKEINRWNRVLLINPGLTTRSQSPTKKVGQLYTKGVLMYMFTIFRLGITIVWMAKVNIIEFWDAKARPEEDPMLTLSFKQ